MSPACPWVAAVGESEARALAERIVENHTKGWGSRFEGSVRAWCRACYESPWPCQKLVLARVLLDRPPLAELIWDVEWSAYEKGLKRGRMQSGAEPRPAPTPAEGR